MTDTLHFDCGCSMTYLDNFTQKLTISPDCTFHKNTKQGSTPDKD